MKLNKVYLAGLLAVLLIFSAGTLYAGNKRIMSIRAAKVLAERALIESMYGLKLRATESVEDMVAANFTDTTESKTKAHLVGVEYEDVVYDAEQDIAQVTASVQMGSITNVDGINVDLGNKLFRRVAFATSTPAMAGPLKALRAAEIDAYKEIIKQVVGFELEGHTKVENFMLTSDVVKTKVMATIFLVELNEYGWTDEGDAFVKMQLNLREASDLLGENIVYDKEIIEIEGMGAQVNDFEQAGSQ